MSKQLEQKTLCSDIRSTVGFLLLWAYFLSSNNGLAAPHYYVLLFLSFSLCELDIKCLEFPGDVYPRVPTISPTVLLLWSVDHQSLLKFILVRDSRCPVHKMSNLGRVRKQLVNMPYERADGWTWCFVGCTTGFPQQ